MLSSSSSLAPAITARGYSAFFAGTHCQPNGRSSSEPSISHVVSFAHRTGICLFLGRNPYDVLYSSTTCGLRMSPASGRRQRLEGAACEPRKYWRVMQ